MAEPRAPGSGAEPGRSIRGLLDVLARRLATATGAPTSAAVWVRRRDGDRVVAATSEASRRPAPGRVELGPDDRGPASGGDGPGAAVPASAVPASAVPAAAAPAAAAPAGAAPAVPTTPAGPVAAVLDGGPDVLLPDLGGPGDWPQWRRAAQEEHVAGAVVVGAGLARGGTLALVVQLTAPGAVDAELARRVARFARQAASLVDLHSTIPARRPPARTAATSGRPRVGVQTAVGALMEVRGCGEEEARRVLTVLATEQGRTLEAVAASVLEHARRPRGARPVRRGA